MAACTNESVVVRVPRHMVVMPVPELFSCDIIDSFPATETLTDIDVARIMIRLYTNNVQCRHSMDAIKEFLEKAKKEADEENPHQPQ